MMADVLMGTSLPKHLSHCGWEPFVYEGHGVGLMEYLGTVMQPAWRGKRPSHIKPGRVPSFCTMGHIHQYWHKDGKWITWGLGEKDLPPTLIGPEPCGMLKRDGGTMLFHIDVHTINRWLAATPAEEVVECLLDPKWKMPHEYFSEELRQRCNL